MKKLAIISSVLFSAGVMLWFTLFSMSVSLNQRFTIEVQTPDGVRSASSVTMVSAVYQKLISTSSLTIKGEAVFVDLGQGKHIIALLDGAAATGYEIPSGRRGNTIPDDVRLAKATMGQVFEVPFNKLPKLVTFTDIDNPATAKLVEPTPAAFTATFGAGYGFRRATVEMMEPGLWPFNQWAGPWPRWLFGEPLTTGIETKLVWINDPELGRNPRWMQLTDIAKNTITSLKRSGN